MTAGKYNQLWSFLVVAGQAAKQLSQLDAGASVVCHNCLRSARCGGQKHNKTATIVAPARDFRVENRPQTSRETRYVYVSK